MRAVNRRHADSRPNSACSCRTHGRDGTPSLFTKIDHVGIAVPDLDAAIAFYRDTFGIDSVHEEINEEQGVREAMLAVGDGVDPHPAARPAVAESHHRQVPRPQRPRRAAGRLHRRRHRRGVARPCGSAGCGCSTTSRAAGTADSRVNFVHPKDAGGVLVELVEPAGSSYSSVTSSDPSTGPTRKAFLDVDDIRTAILTDELAAVGDLPVPDDLPGAGGARRRGRNVRRHPEPGQGPAQEPAPAGGARPRSSARARRSWR